MKFQNLRKLICVLLVLLLVVSAVCVPAFASEIALYAALAVSARSAIASLIRACGVYVADGVESDLTRGLLSFESLTDSVLSYVWEKLPDNLKMVNTLGDLMIKMALKNGVYYAPRTVVELVCDGLTQEIPDIEYIDFATQLGYSLESEHLNLFNRLLSTHLIQNSLIDPELDPEGFSYPGQFAEKYQYCRFVDIVPHVRNEDGSEDDDTVYLSPLLIFTKQPFDDVCRFTTLTDAYGDFYIKIRLPADSEVLIFYATDLTIAYHADFDIHRIGDSVRTYSFICSDCTYYTMERQNSNSVVIPEESGLSYENDVATISSTWDANSVTVTNNKIDNSPVTMLPVSVYESSNAATVSSPSAITSGTVMEEDTEEVTETVPETGTDTGTDSGTTDLSGILGFLQKILNAILALPQLITDPIGSVVNLAANSIVSYLSDGKIKLNNIAEQIASIGSVIKEAITAVIPESWAKSIEDKLTSMEDFFSATKDAILSIPETLTNIWEWVKTVPQILVDALAAVFIPAEGYLDAKVDALLSTYTFLNGFSSDAKFLKSQLSGLGTTPPVIYIPLGSSETSYSIGSDTIFLDLSWYAKYKPTVDAILSAFLWILFIWKLFLKLPGIVSGLPGDFVMGGLNDFGLADHLPSRKASYEIQRQSNREYIRKGGK